MIIVMSEISRLPSRAIAINSDRPRGYRLAEEVRNRAAATNHNETPHERRALLRLEKVLSNKDTPRTDVPRGFYLDIKI